LAALSFYLSSCPDGQATLGHTPRPTLLSSRPIALLTLGPHPSVNCSWPSLPFCLSISSPLCAVIGRSLSSDSLAPLLRHGMWSRFPSPLSALFYLVSSHCHTPLPHVSPRPPILRDMGVLWGTEARECSVFGWAAYENTTSFHVRASPVHVRYQSVPRTPRPLREAHGEACLVRQHRVNTCVNTSPAVSTPTVLTPICLRPLVPPLGSPNRRFLVSQGQLQRAQQTRCEASLPRCQLQRCPPVQPDDS
jgi:hypothetical protein